ncbi:recombinase family protein [Gammaproteobacteria bacterium]|nr:recombinase family protein [Gammaproteobacteria bacterium]
MEYLHEDKDWGYRVIAKKMNSWGIKTQRGKTWSNGSVHSVLKRMHQRDVRIENIRNKKFPIDISSLSFRKNFY